MTDEEYRSHVAALPKLIATAVKYDLGQDINKNRTTVEQTVEFATNKIKWQIVVEASNQRDNSQRIYGLTTEQLIMLGRIGLEHGDK